MADLAPSPVRLPLVTYILCNRNEDGRIGLTIESLKAQDYPRYEVVVVDDASDDDSREAIGKHIDGEPAFNTLYLDERRGPFAAALEGLKIANGAFVSFVTPDEYLTPNHASILVQLHLAVTQTTTVASGGLAKVASDGSLLTGSVNALADDDDPLAHHEDLRPSFLAPRLSTVDEVLYAQFRDITRAYHHSGERRRWDTGAANMYRRFVLECVRPVGDIGSAYDFRPDQYFSLLSHLFGGSARCSIPVGTVRTRAEDYRLESFDRKRPQATHLPPWECRLLMARAVLDRASDLQWRVDGRITKVLDRILGEPPNKKGYAGRDARDLLASHATTLIDVLGRPAARRYLRNRLGRPMLRSTPEFSKGKAVQQDRSGPPGKSAIGS
ncbi:glycosyltransferase [Bauldia sp.]|uniref:glycosyltransferase n=1 Tax=Bauldia sp. TaxID=2575872 RepID=UPI003BA84C41